MINLLGFFKCGWGHTVKDLVFILPGDDDVVCDFEASDFTSFDLLCSECGEDFDTTLINIPHGLPGGEGKLIDVDYAEETETPRSFTVNQTQVEIETIDAMIQLPRHRPLQIGDFSKTFGIYIVDTKEGRCVIEARPHREPDGTHDWDKPEWYLIDVDKEGTVLHFLETGRKPAEPIKPRGEPPEIREMGDNIKAYRLLYLLENRVRQLVMSKLKQKYPEHGENWWKAVLPKDVVRYIKEKLSQISKSSWFPAKRREEPISYTTFAQLRDIIKEKSEAFKGLFTSKDIDILLGNLTKLELLRNIVAHNRRLDHEEFQELQHTVQETYRAIGEKANRSINA